MAKKGGGFRGYKPVMSTSAGSFARRGDPWVTDKEGRRDFDRQVEIENPDMDADRQRYQRLQNFSKEFQDRIRKQKPIDFRMTMREAIETERSTRLDGYQAEKAKPRLPKSGEWAKPGKDFEVATVQRRVAAVAMRLKREIREIEQGTQVARTHEEGKISCPYSCGYVTHDSRNISKHLRKFRNSCCSHPKSCQCPDCKYSRNELISGG